MDESLASAIRSRGLGFTLTRKAMDKLVAKAKGKPHSLAVLRELVVLSKGTVEVHTEPRIHIILDGVEVGATNTDGLFVLGVVEGNHELICRGAGYRDAGSKFLLDGNEVKRFTFPMEWIGGFLSISAQPADARITVSGPWSSVGSVKDAKVPSGYYTATVSLDTYHTQTRNFQIGAGEHHVEQFQLAIDVAAAKAKADAGDLSTMNLLLQAIEHGYEVDCNVKTSLMDWQVGQIFVIDGTVTVSKRSVSYRRTTGGDRNQPNFTVSPEKILLLAFENTSPPGVHLKISTMNSEGTKENKHDFRFYNPHAEVIDTRGRAGYTYTRGVACDGCDNSLNVMYALLEAVKTKQ